jgi:protein tyrosine phosphatase (PTP) superfamily phosphohydrolase (DUF442 family)
MQLYGCNDSLLRSGVQADRTPDTTGVEYYSIGLLESSIVKYRLFLPTRRPDGGRGGLPVRPHCDTGGRCLEVYSEADFTERGQSSQRAAGTLVIINMTSRLY